MTVTEKIALILLSILVGLFVLSLEILLVPPNRNRLPQPTPIGTRVPAQTTPTYHVAD